MSKSIEGITIGDLHLDKLSKLFPDNHLELQLSEIDNAIEYGIRHGVSFAVFLGDIGEYSSLSSQAFNELVRRICQWETKLPLHLFLGNHDWQENGVHSLVNIKLLEEFGLFKNTQIHVKPKVVTVDGQKFNFRPYPFQKAVPDALNFGHFETNGSIRDNGTPTKSKTRVTGHWQMGHLHTPHKAGNVVYPGTMYQLNFGESLPKGFCHFKWDGVTQHTRFIENDPRFKLLNIVVNSKQDLKQVKEIPLHRYRLLVQSSFDLDDQFLSDNPTIVKVEGYKSKSELAAIMKDSFITFEQQTLDQYSIIDGLESFLAKKLMASQVKRGMKIIEELRHEVSTAKMG